MENTDAGNLSAAQGQETLQGRENQPDLDGILREKGLQAQFDRRVQKALATARAKWEAETAETVARAREEAEQLGAMSAEQRAEHARIQREEGLTQREMELTRQELHAQALEALAEKGLPRELAQVLFFTDAETLTTDIGTLETAFRASVQAGVEERLRGVTPAAGGSAASGAPANMEEAVRRYYGKL